MKKPVTFIYFDIGGVLLSWREGHIRAAKKYGVPHEAVSRIVDAHWAAACRGTLSNADYMAMFAKVFGLRDPLPDLTDFWTDHYTPILETHTLVHELKGSYRIGLLTNAENGAMKHATKKGLLPVIPWASVVDSSQLGTIKPETKIYEIAEKAAGVPPEEIFFIDDVPEYVEIAKSRGWQGMVFDTKDVVGSIKMLRIILCG